MFGNKSRAKKLRRQAEQSRFVPAEALVSGYAAARPLVERLLSDEELRDDIREFTQSARKIADRLSDGDARDVLTRLWDDDKLRKDLGKEIEHAAETAHKGVDRVSGKKKRGGSGGIVLLGLSAVVAALFLNPKTGPTARQLVKSALGVIK